MPRAMSPCSWDIAVPAAPVGHSGLATKVHRTPSVLHNRGEGLWLQRGAADQRSVNFFLRHQGSGVFWFYRSSVQNTHMGGEFFSEHFAGLAADDRMSLGRELWSGGFSRADGPHRFVSHNQPLRLLRGNCVESPDALSPKNIVGKLRLALFQHFANAADGGESGF